LPFVLSFIANIARKKPELNRDKTNQSHPEFRTEVAIETVNGDEMRINKVCPPEIMNTVITLSLCPLP
jgi:hypothetical protein